MKDPAFLFYSSDFLSGTMLMTDEEIGQYIKLLCLQHQKGHLKEKDMLNICNSYEEHMETETATITETININNINMENLQKKFIECIGSTNLNSIDECLSYLNELPYEVIEIALKKTADVNGNWKYAKVILNNWVKNKIDTVEKVETEELNFKNKGKPPTVETPEEKTARRIKELKEAIKDGS